MASCEKCWQDSDGDAIIYANLLHTRKYINKCTPEEQAGELATLCPNCNRKTIHHWTGDCMVLDCG